MDSFIVVGFERKWIEKLPLLFLFYFDFLILVVAPFLLFIYGEGLIWRASFSDQLDKVLHIHDEQSSHFSTNFMQNGWELKQRANAFLLPSVCVWFSIIYEVFHSFFIVFFHFPMQLKKNVLLLLFPLIVFLDSLFKTNIWKDSGIYSLQPFL